MVEINCLSKSILALIKNDLQRGVYRMQLSPPLYSQCLCEGFYKESNSDILLKNNHFSMIPF
jgi:hypothetical protein